MDKLKKCKLHNLFQDTVCVGQLCQKRIGCELCIRKHDHKFYLDSKSKQSPLSKIQKQLDDKLSHLKNYIKSNISSLKLQQYKDKILQNFEEQLLFLKTKIDQQTQNFAILMQKTMKYVETTLQELKTQMLNNWQHYYDKSILYQKGEQEYEQLKQYFKNGDWTIHQHVEKGVNFLYSEEVLFKFNRNLDNLKRVMHFHKKQNNYIFSWLYDIRLTYPDFQLCPHQTFKNFMSKYKQKPIIPSYQQSKTKQLRDDEQSILQKIIDDKKALLIYPKLIYQPFQHVYKLIRFNNLMFATSGARSINLWSKVNLQPQKVFQLDYTSYGLSSFCQKGEDDSDVLLFGKSNGEIGHLNIQNYKLTFLKAHDAAIRDIIQFDEFHFLTASQDWLIKLWALNDKSQKKFASQRGLLKGHSGKVHCLCKFGPSVLAGGADGTIKLWDVQSQSFDETFVHQKQIYSIAQIRPQLFISGGQFSQLKGYDYRIPKTCAFTYKVINCCNSILRYNQNSFLFADRNFVNLIDIRSFKDPIQRYENKDTYSHAINAMAYLSDMQIGMGGSDNFVTIWKY